MSYELNVRPEGLHPCLRCSGQAEHELCEWVDDAAGVPLYSAIRRTVRCRKCGWWVKKSVDPITRQKFPRLPGLMWRTVVTWLLLALLAASVVAFFVNDRRLRREFVANPQIGDLWTIETDGWPGSELENGAKYGVLRVSAFDARQIALFACDTSSDKAANIEDNCETYRIELEPLPREKTIALLDDGAIENVRSDRDNYTLWFLLGGGWAALIIIHALTSRRFLRAAERATREPPKA
jgi:hypothetical protein